MRSKLTLIVMSVVGCLAFSGFGTRWLRADDTPAKKPAGNTVRVACVGDRPMRRQPLLEPSEPPAQWLCE